MPILNIITENMVKALIFTIGVELIVLCLFNIKKIYIYAILILMNIVTNLSMNYFLSIIQSHTFDYHLYLFEIVIIFVEMMVYYLWIKDIKKAFYISLACNSASLIFGLLLMPFIY